MNRPRHRFAGAGPWAALSALCLLSVPVCPCLASTATITGVTIEDVSSHSTAFQILKAECTLDGSGGIPLDSFTGSHGTEVGNPAGPATPTMWLSNCRKSFCGRQENSGIQVGDPHLVANDGRLAHIVYDLGAVYNVSAFKIWNYNGFNPLGGGFDLSFRGAKLIEIHVSADNNMAGMNITGQSERIFSGPLPQATGRPDYEGALFNSSFVARYVRIDIFSNYYTGVMDSFNAVHVGLSEIRFAGEKLAASQLK